LKYSDLNAAKKTDFLGLNYYSHSHLKFKANPNEFFENKFFKKDTMTDMPYVIYPEGLYRAIKEVEKIRKPIIITENGIADSKDDRRSLFIERYLYSVYKAMSEGSNIQGYFYWSLMDNFEWAEGYDMKFGLYEVNFKNQNRKLRNGSKKFIEIVKKNL
jgi:beta-glucosidase